MLADRAKTRESERSVEPLRALHVVAGLEPEDGGPTYSVPRLCGALAASGRVEPILFSISAGAGSEKSATAYEHRRFARDRFGVPFGGRLRTSSGLSRALAGASPGAAAIHGHGLWLAPNVLSGRVARRAGVPLVISPRGMLSPAALGFSRWKKRLMWTLAQGSVVRGAACIHATSEAERNEVRALGLRNPVATIPNGIDVPAPPPDLEASPGAARTVLYLGRIHPKKGLRTLVEAWAQVEPRRPEWRLRIIGPAEDGSDTELRRLVQAKQLQRVEIEGAVYGEGKLEAYRRSELFVLPSLNENFGLTVAEALAAGLPVISTRGAPWGGLARERCGWWVDHGVEALAASLANATAMPRQALKVMGANGRAWMQRDFSWDRVAAEMADVYAWLARGAEPPACVHFD